MGLVKYFACVRNSLPVFCLSRITVTAILNDCSLELRRKGEVRSQKSRVKFELAILPFSWIINLK